MRYKTRLWMIAAAGGILTLLCFLYSIKSQETVQFLTRPQSGSGSTEQKLQVELQGERYPFAVTLREVPYKEAELQSLLQNAADGLEELFLGENADLQQIMADVQMPSVYPGTQVSVQWYMDSWEYIQPDGKVCNEGLKEAAFVKVQAVLTLNGQSLEWEREATVCPVKNPDVLKKLQLLQYEITKAQQDPGSRIELPTSVSGEPVAWYQEADKRWVWMLALTLLALAAMVIGQRRDEDAAQQQRQRSMQMDYPEIVSRLSLYMGAGISTRKAWERIIQNYENRQDQTKKGRPAYEEMRTALYEMQNGVSETAAYERFGTRCRLPAYLKLGTLLSQNLRKGTKNLAGLLQEESREAFEDRKALAKRLGEECESRLLFPMLLMLLTILIIIMYPAVISFQM